MLSDNLKRAREKKGFSKAQLAREIDVPYTTYNGYETQNKQPKLEILKKLADKLDVDLNELLYNEQELEKLEEVERQAREFDEYYRKKHGDDWELKVYGLGQDAMQSNEEDDILQLISIAKELSPGELDMVINLVNQLRNMKKTE